ncbi:MAG: peptidoglycan-associated lipoprotein Pal [Deltaproteobacteria bacterium]|nr:MAG: peptidoglycan-associated lipoprotein Pal [Deltaproteobacteria bacterium]
MREGTGWRLAEPVPHLKVPRRHPSPVLSTGQEFPMKQTVSVAAMAVLGGAVALGIGCKKKPAETAPAAVAPVTEAPAPVEEAPAEVQEMALNFSRVYFEFDQATLNAASKAALDSNAEIMKKKTDIKVEIQGHADERGTTDYNLALGTRRAQAVRDYLVAQGIAPSRLTVVSYGEERPLVQGHSETAWSQNRRAEFRITWGDAGNVQGTVP